MMIFKKLRNKNNPYDITEVSVETEVTTLTEALEEFKLFLMACGFPIDFTDSLIIEKFEDTDET